MKGKHPPELYWLCVIHLFERFSFYGVAGILVTFFTDHIHYSDSKAFEYFGCFLALSYGFSLVSGWLADRYLGKDICIIVGLIAIALGCLSLANHYYSLIPIGLSIIALGVGCFKPNISAFLGQMYPENDSRLENAYILFYMAINVGALSGIVLIGFITQYAHWYYSFIATSLASVVALIVYFGVRRSLLVREMSLYPNMVLDAALTLKKILYFIFLSIVLVCCSYYLIQSFDLTGWVLCATTLLCIAYLTIKVKNESSVVLKRIVMIFVLVMIFICYNAIILQSMTSITLFADRNVDRDLFGFIFPTSSLQGLNPCIIIISGPFLMLFWSWLRRKGCEPRDIVKFAYGLLFLAGSFFVLYVAALISERTTLGSSILWLVLANVLSTLGEMFIGPIGLTSIKRLAPTHLLSMFMSIWLLGAAYGSYLSAYIAKFTSAPVNAAIHRATITAQIYAKDFSWLAIISFVLSALVFVLSKIVGDAGANT